MATNTRRTITPQQILDHCASHGNPNPTLQDVEAFYRFNDILDVDADTAEEAYQKVMASMDIMTTADFLMMSFKLSALYPPITEFKPEE